ncbi:MAG: ribonuclease HII [Candidatus Liptonbacteria bacterium]|nr:ribonuclease HII [Candidatus Liptonbacteria bacterium]
MDKFIIGIDEVGRGALAGPVTVAAVCLPKKMRFPAVVPVPYRSTGQAPAGTQVCLELKDSKKLSPKQRETWFEYLKNHPKINYAVARVYPRQIEKRNISGAANLAAMRAYKHLVHSSKFMVHGAGHKVVLDGGLFLGSKKAQPENAKTVTKGDEKFGVVAAASIVAKVSRDRAMVRLAKQHPQYGFEIHKGYGTKKHMAAIKRYGPTRVHRLTFLGKFDNMIE